MKKTLTLTLKMSEIIYDVQNKTYLTGKALNNGENHSHIATMQANDDEENASQVLRSITMAVAMLRNRLSEYLDTGSSSSGNEMMEPDDNLELTLSMPSNFNNAVGRVVGEAAHQFIVSTAVADWFAITAKGETFDYTVSAVKALEVLEEALCKRSRPSRINNP